MTRLAIEGANDLAIDEWAIKWLKSRGYVVALSENWEMPGEMCKRLKVSSAHLSSTLKDRRCPKPLDEIRGESGRLSYLFPSQRWMPSSASTTSMNLERDPREWVILEEDEKRVVFVAGNGVKIRTSKKGNIYQEWLREMKRIAEGGPVVQPVVELQEGVVIEPVSVDRSYTPPSASEAQRSSAEDLIRSEINAASITKSSLSFTGGWNNSGASCVIACGASMKRISAPGSCKIIEKIEGTREAMPGRAGDNTK